jgi:sister chromatid cohesion protein PDS5
VLRYYTCQTSSLTYVRALAEQVISEYILPLPSASSSSGKTSEVDEAAWTDRLLTIMKNLDAPEKNTLFGLSGIKTR